MLYDPTAKRAKDYNFVKDPAKSRKRKSPNYSIFQNFDGAESSLDVYVIKQLTQLYQR